MKIINLVKKEETFEERKKERKKNKFTNENK